MKKVQRYFYYLFAYIFSKAVLLLPFKTAVKAGGLFGFLAFKLIKSSRQTALENIAAAFPELSKSEVYLVAKRSFINLGKNAFELFLFPKINKENIHKLVTFIGKENLERALAEKKGVLMTSAHCADWELIGPTLAFSGFKLNVVARNIYIQRLNDMLVRFRTSKGYSVVLRSGREAARQILSSIRNNEILALLIDQDTNVPGVFVNFFGKEAWTPSGLAQLARRTKAPVVLALDCRKPGDTHEVLITGPFEMQNTNDESADIIANTQLLTSKIEEHIREYPDQWVWVHKRWKTKRSAD